MDVNISPPVRNIPSGKATVLLLGAIIFVSLYFWLASRYPALNLKSIMGNQATLHGIGFDVLLFVEAQQPLWQRIAYTTVNWIYSNLYGMTFGLILAPLVLTLFSLRPIKPIKNAFVASIAGALAGFPLGVCANCATPVAQGLYSAKARIETVLALIVSAPSLNIVVITMMLSLLPLYFVIIKLACSLFIILLIIPLICRILPPEKIKHHASLKPKRSTWLEAPGAKTYTEAHSASWLTSLQWVTSTVVRHFFYVAKITVPLMLVAGLLGAIAITLLPPNTLLNLETQGYPAKIMALLATATIGTLLPIPIAFDAIVVSLLHELKLEPKYSVTLLVTLGSFSIYPYFVIARFSGFRFITLFTSILIILGFSAGLVAHYATPTVNQWHQQRIFKHVTQIAAPLTLIKYQAKYTIEPPLSLIPIPSHFVLQQDTINITQQTYAKPSVAKTNASTLFDLYLGASRGIDTSYQFSAESQTDRAFFRNIASGDVNHDDLADILLTDNDGLKLFINQGGAQFLQTTLASDNISLGFISAAALADLNNDGLLDIVFASTTTGINWLQNQQGLFDSPPQVIHNNAKAIITSSLGFADINQDHILDIVLGHWSVGDRAPHLSLPSSANTLLTSDGDQYQHTTLPCNAGETYTTLLSDINGDQTVDLLVGNDFFAPDCLYTDNTFTHFQRQGEATSWLKTSSHFTMSYSSADINNDGLLDIFSSDISHVLPGPSLPYHEVCSAYIDTQSHYKNCLSILKLTESTAHKTRLTQCQQLKHTRYEDDCTATALYASILNLNISCASLPKQWPNFLLQCQDYRRAVKESWAISVNEHNSRKQNMLHVQQADHQFKETAKTWGIENSGWAWNAQFADLNNDQWQDLYVVNGSHRMYRPEKNHLYLNKKGEGFHDVSDTSGLNSYAITSSYAYFDIDNDGDIDIITNPLFAPVEIYINQTPPKNSLQIQLQDTRGNYFGVGSKVTIHYGKDQIQLREVLLSGGVNSFNQALLHFGLADYKTIEAISIIWPDGEQHKFVHPFKTNHRYLIRRN